MTFEERIEALIARHEALTERQEALTESVQLLTRDVHAMQTSHSRLEAFVNEIAEGTARLLAVAQARTPPR